MNNLQQHFQKQYFLFLRILVCIFVGAMIWATTPAFYDNSFAAAAKKPAKKSTQQKVSPAPAVAGAAAGATVATAAGTQAATQSDSVVEEPAPEEVQWPDGPEGDAARAYSRRNYAEARRIWEKMAASGDSQAMNNLGVLYDQGQGVDVDAGRAAYWFAQSANAGNPAGMSNYGRMLEQGRGMPANPEEAARWFDMAARQGQPEAQYNLGFLYENGRGVPRDDAAAAAWYSRAASLKQPDALARLGHLYRRGQGVTRDTARGALLLYAAAMEGSSAAIKELEEMARDNPNKAEAILFGQHLNECTRNGMREALKKIGATAKSENDNKICDVYSATNIVPGAGEMAICYGPNGHLAFVKIDYAAADKKRADAVLKMVESRFGAPTAGEGEDARLWNLGPVIVATQYAPTHKQMSLMYMVPKVYYLTKNR